MEKWWRTPLLYFEGEQLGEFSTTVLLLIGRKIVPWNIFKVIQFFCPENRKRLLAENKWWTFFESLTDWFGPAVWEVPALFHYLFETPLFRLQHPPQSTQHAGNLTHLPLPLCVSLPPNPLVILWTQCSLLWCLIVGKNINITLVILLTHILQMGYRFFIEWKGNLQEANWMMASRFVMPRVR